jgi:TonB family protein
MSALESHLLAYLLNALWQAPLVFAAAWLAARAVRRLGPAAEHRIWAAALVLETVLPACSLPLSARAHSLWHLLLRALGAAHSATTTGVTVTLGDAHPTAALRPPTALLHALTILYAAVTVLLAARLARSLWKTMALRRRAEPITPTEPITSAEPLTSTDELSLIWTRCSHVFCITGARLALSPEISGPITIGLRRRTVLLPAAWPAALPADDLATAIAHEFAHMRRRDFAANLVYQVLSLPIALHPAVWFTRTQLTETREMLCDELAADALAGRDHYARSLLRLASTIVHGAPATTLHAIGIFDANIFERRVMNLTQNRLDLRGPRRIATLAAVVLLGAVACTSALALRLELAAPSPMASPQPAPQPAAQPAAQPQPAPRQTSPAPVRVSGGVMAGQIVSKVNPVYPPDAKAAGISGTVVLHAIIGADGAVQNLAVVSGPPELQSSALDAVKQWIYKPYLLNGNPTEVETTITVNYSLNP